MNKKLKGKYVLVTGASAGLGKAIAYELASRKINVIITARREEKLLSLKKELEEKFKIDVIALKSDLRKQEEREKVFQNATKQADIYGIINNAGLTYYGYCEFCDDDFKNSIISLNFNGVIDMTLMFYKYFLKKGEGQILNISSLGGLTPLPFQSLYSATKNGIQTFTTALRGENTNNKIIIASFCPGGITTEMYSSSGLQDKLGEKNIFNMSPEKTAKIAVNSFIKGKKVTIPGIFNKINYIFFKILPQSLIQQATKIIYKPPKK